MRLKIDLMICLKDQRPKSIATTYIPIDVNWTVDMMNIKGYEILQKWKEENPFLKHGDVWQIITYRN